MKGEDYIIGYLYNGIIRDLHENLSEDSKLKSKKILKSSSIGLEILRHSCAHILAQAIIRVFSSYAVYFATGPTTENGFFYDCQIQDRDSNFKSISSKDLYKIEKEMMQIIDQNLQFTKKYIPKQNFFLENTYDPLKEIVLSGIKDENISIYTQSNGDSKFSDLCRGPHVLNSSILSKFLKLTNVSEVLWKDQKVQRVNGIYFNTQEELDFYEKNKELQIANDHKKLGLQMDLFSFNEMAPGFAFWHPKGLNLINKIKKIINEIGYKGFHQYDTPTVFKQDLFEKTGHLQNYRENMFLLEDMCLKPMNCPGHAIMFSKRNFSYRDLPYRIGEFGGCFRNEEHGGLNGLKRGRKLTIDDGHIFCEMKQMFGEIEKFLQDAERFYEIFGFKDLKIKLATRPQKSIGTEDMWQKAEEVLRNSLENYDYILAPGDGAFYGPKIELHLKDNLGRYWQCGTIQVDFFLAERLGSSFINSRSEKEFPIILHRAISGSIERFIGVLLENGKLPLFLLDNPMVILPISENFKSYGEKILNLVESYGISVSIDNNSETLNKKLKKSLDLKVPYIVIVGEQELENNTVTVRFENENKSMDMKFFEQLLEKIKNFLKY